MFDDDPVDDDLDNDYHPPFPIPSPAEFARLGVTVHRELHGGHQSRVVLASDLSDRNRRPMVIKLIDGTLVDRAQALARLQVRDHVSMRDDRVVPLLSLAGSKVNRIGDCLAVASPLIEGRIPEVANRPDVERMGRALARLHQSLRLVHADLPLVTPLSIGDPIEGLHENHQLLHGDFFCSNLVLDDGGRLWIFDFDDCGFGPIEFELGNTLFMALFDTSPSLNQPSEDYRQFRRWFVGAYKASAEHAVSDLLIDIALQARSDALRYWLNHLDEAPVGIRTSSPAWQRHLRAFAGVVQR